jgi:iron complex outermembrane recepter protein
MRTVLTIILACMLQLAQAQDAHTVRLRVITAPASPVAGATLQVKKAADSSLVKYAFTNAEGWAQLDALQPGTYFVIVSHSGMQNAWYGPFNLPLEGPLPDLLLQRSSVPMEEVRVTGRRRFIEQSPGKTTVNLDASPTNAGTTMLEALEKMPGITVDRNGGISLKGRSNVLVLIDDKPTYLSGTDLVNLLNGMNTSAVDRVELMDQPPARYDAAGNGGVIVIRMKKNRQKGFNGNASSAYAQGRYYKTNHSLQLNYRNGRHNLFGNYSFNANRNYMELEALRTYFNPDHSVRSMLDQPALFKMSGLTHSLRVGWDYNLTPKTTFGLQFTGNDLARRNNTTGAAFWKNASGGNDSVIRTITKNHTDWQNAGLNANLRHAVSGSKNVSGDIDVLFYGIDGMQQTFNTKEGSPANDQAYRGDLPSTISIYSAKADYSYTPRSGNSYETGWKSSYINTDNRAAYDLMENGAWTVDLGKTNHFRYEETIHAAYGTAHAQKGKWAGSAGLRLEHTAYNAHQLGNAVQKDSAFSRSYTSLFPTGSLQYAADSQHSFNITVGRRIDRPAFQKLNPFTFIINKYTYQRGNPFFKPQYTWNIGLSHQFRELLVTSVTYSRTDDYFSQFFFRDPSGQVIYTEGNLGTLHNWGFSVSVNASPVSWWTLSSQGTLTHKRMDGTVISSSAKSITQFNGSLNNQFRFGKGWTGEVSGNYTSRSRVDLQELLDPAGQLSVGVAKTMLKGKGTARIAARDIFHTQIMAGFTEIPPDAQEPFSLTRDTRIVLVSFSYRFGKPLKGTAKRSQGAATEEVQRVGTAN